MISQRLVTAVKIIVSSACVAVLYHHIDLERFSQLLATMHWPWIVLALIIFWAAQCVSALRYRMIVHTLGAGLDYRTSLRAHFIGLWFNQVLPTSLGGDVVKMSLLQKHIGLGVAVRAGILDRLSGLVFVMAAIVLTLPFYVQLLPGSPLPASLALMAGGFIAALMVCIFARELISKPFSRFPSLAKGFQLLADMAAFTRGRPLWEQAWTSGVVHFNGIAAYGLLGLALGVKTGLSVYVLMVPLVFVIALMPLSLAGWGVREVGSVWLFGLVGIDAETALAMSVGFGILLIFSAFPGLVLFMTQGAPAAQPVARRD